ncbi:hypothetical protein ACFLT9_12510 [Acidobacteriota bacterium]
MEKRFAFSDLKPKKGKFLYHVFGSTIALFTVVFLYMWADYGKILNFGQGIRLLGMIFLLVLVIWSAVYLLKALMNKAEK